MGAEPFTSVMIGPVELPNRFALAPVKSALGGTDGKATPRHVAHYRRRAEGGVGLIITDPPSKVLEAAGLDVKVVGDAAHPGRILEATRSGYEAVRSVGRAGKKPGEAALGRSPADLA